MRPQTAKQRINNVLWNQFIEKQGITKDLIFLQQRLKTIEPELQSMYKKYLKNEEDYRSGSETYGYEFIEKIKSNLVYVSDRWQCAFRTKWLLDLIKLDIKGIT